MSRFVPLTFDKLNRLIGSLSLRQGLAKVANVMRKERIIMEKDFPEIVRTLRKKKGWAQGFLGKQIGKSATAISQLENKRDAHVISLEIAMRIISALELVGASREEAERAAIRWSRERAESLKYRFGLLIHELIGKYNVQVTDIAKWLKCKGTLISSWRSGKKKLPAHDMMADLIEYFESFGLPEEEKLKLIRTYVSDVLRNELKITTFVTEPDIEKMVASVFGESA
jgi:transcriptional regulator with XRE-family HTH domain